MFGFSRGAYTARFLAEMLDHVGLVAQGNEEMVLFAWKTFSNWQQRHDSSKKRALYEYMRAFRETFARPVRRVRFLGLFDTVNSVPRFEQAWLKRSSGFPYTARSMWSLPPIDFMSPLQSHFDPRPPHPTREVYFSRAIS
jgi:uncharacterized protein (DUF2235 family)